MEWIICSIEDNRAIRDNFDCGIPELNENKNQIRIDIEFQLTGSFKDEPAFEEVLALGQAIRQGDESVLEEKDEL
ncbi:hypothetical protein QUA43_13345 [Microcoleus sp. N9_B4]|jgi:hypothetical protein|uniref:hypothetical protein n=1 Tax=Microcoleus sp. N9_B4 TaxID=3055386 RepID=UPI002FCEEF36